MFNKICVIILLLVTLTGCDIFNPREAEEPLLPQQWNEFFTSWKLTLENLEYAFEDKRNKDNYLQILTSDFQFEMDDNDALALGLQKPYTWLRSAEIELLVNMHSNLSVSDSVWVIEVGTIDSNEISTDEVEVDIQYEIEKRKGPHDPNAHIEDPDFVGEATLIFIEVSGYWELKRWYDIRKDGATNPTWGILKYEYVQ